MGADIMAPVAGPGSGEAQEAAVIVSTRNKLLVKLVRDCRLLLIAVWLGASVFFSFAVAPGLFLLLPTRDLAGTVVSRMLGIINTGGFIIGLLLLTSVFLFKSIASNRAFVLEILALLLVTLCSFIGKWIIAAKMHELRVAMALPIDEVAQSDPLRIAFNSLHGYSVTGLTIAMVAGIVSLLLIARRAGG
jgi:hypothetical protein